MVIRKEPIQDQVNTRKNSKEITLIDVEKYFHKETPALFRHKVDYKEDTNEKTCCSDNSTSETDECVRNPAK